MCEKGCTFDRNNILAKIEVLHKNVFVHKLDKILRF